jgi:hypothetical protein
MGYKPKSPLDFLAEKGLTVSEGIPDLQIRIRDLEAHREAARDAIKHSADRQAYQFDKGHKAPEFEVGDEVLINPHSLELVNEKGFSHKLMQRKIGPFEIIEVISPTAYKLRLPNSYKGHNVFNLQHLTKYLRSNELGRPKLMNPRDTLPSSEEYKVEKIVGEQRRKGKLYYCVRWKGYNAKDDTWQTAWDLRNAPELVKAWRQQLWCQASKHKEPLSGNSHLDMCKLHNLHSTSISSYYRKIDMSNIAQNLAIARIPGSRALVNDRAPIEAGRKRGYFNDSETRILLSLNKGDFLRADGTYGSKELASSPVNFSSLREGSYDHRLLPFAPKRRGMMRRLVVELRKKNKQWMPVAHSIRELGSELENLRKDAEAIAQKTSLPLPEYVHWILPLLLYRLTDISEALECQFQPWFNPEAHQARWRRIERVAGQLEGYINAGHLLLNPSNWTWHFGKPIGIKLDPTDVKTLDRGLGLAYAYLAIPISLPADWKVPQRYSLQDARKALLDDLDCLTTPRATFSEITDLPEDHYNNLTFSVVRPQFSEHRYNADGTRTTKTQRKQLEEGESSDMAEDGGSIISEDDVSRPAVMITEVKEGLQPSNEPAPTPFEPFTLSLPDPSSLYWDSALQIDTSAGLMPPVSTSNPASTSTSAQASAISSTSSTNIPLPSTSGNRATPKSKPEKEAVNWRVPGSF